LRSLLLLLLLRPLLVLLGSPSPGSWSELILVLSECVVEPPWIGDLSPGPDEFDHLSSFGDVDRPGFVLIVSLWDWEFDDFVQYAWGQSVEEEPYGFLIADGVASLSYQVFEI
jgi:hypothetical protein